MCELARAEGPGSGTSCSSGALGNADSHPSPCADATDAAIWDANAVAHSETAGWRAAVRRIARARRL